MYNHFPASIDRLYIEFDARLTAMKTFLNDLRGDPGARPFLVRFADGLRATLAAERTQSPNPYVDDSPIYQALQSLHFAVMALPDDGACDSTSWQEAHLSHQRCEAAFSQFRKSLRNTAPLHHNPTHP